MSSHTPQSEHLQQLHVDFDVKVKPPHLDASNIDDAQQAMSDFLISISRIMKTSRKSD